MSDVSPVLAVIPARGGSKGLPGKNTRELAGIPLIAHSILCARACPQVDRVVVSTDDERIASVAREYGADVPFMRPANLATDTTPMLPVLQHCLNEVERIDGRAYRTVLLLSPTNPGRLPEDVAAAYDMLARDPGCDGIIGVSQPSFNIAWQTVALSDAGYMQSAFENFARSTRRQEVPEYFYINGLLYLWRSEFIKATNDWRQGRLAVVEIPRQRAFDIDTLDDFDDAAFSLQTGRLTLPWLQR